MHFNSYLLELIALYDPERDPNARYPDYGEKLIKSRFQWTTSDADRGQLEKR